MEIYLDTGNVDEIRKAAETGMLSGVTTNPTLIAKEGRDFKQVITEIARILERHTQSFTVSAETHSTDADGMVKEGIEYAKYHKNVIVKVPMTRDGIIAVQQLGKRKIRCNVTLCFSPNQALLAAKAGAYIVSPFVGRIDDHGGEGMELIEQIREIYDNYEFATKILVASVRHPGHVRDAALLGADIVTLPATVFEQLFAHPLTDKGLEKFLADYRKSQAALEQGKRA